MSNAVEWYYCPSCQRERPTLNPVPEIHDVLKVATLGALPIFLGLLGNSALPVRCAVCFGAIRASFGGEAHPVFPQTQGEIDSRLSIFDSGARATPDARHLAEYFDHRNGLEELKESGFQVGGQFEKILHVARIYPEYLLQGYVGKFFYLLFLPIAYLHLRYRRSKYPRASFFPLDRHRAGRAIVTTQRLVIYTDVQSFSYRQYSIPLHVIREVRQHYSSVRVQLDSNEIRTLTIRIGPELGGLLRALHKLAEVKVRDPARHW